MRLRTLAGALAVALSVCARGALAQGAPVDPTCNNDPCFTITNPGVVKATGVPQSLTALASYQQITSLSTAASLTVPTGAKLAIITVETAGVRWRDDGTAPTASVGTPIAAGTGMTYAGPLAAIQFIAQSGSPVVNVAYYR